MNYFKKSIYLIVYIITIIIFSGCASQYMNYYPSNKLIEPIKQNCNIQVNIPLKSVPKRNRSIEALESIKKNITRDVKEKILESTIKNQKPIEIVVNVIKLKHRFRLIDVWLAPYSIFLPFPFTYHKYVCELEMIIKDSNGDVIAIYNAEEKITESLVFSGKSGELHDHTWYLGIVLKKTMETIKDDINNDQMGSDKNINFIVNKVREGNKSVNDGLIPEFPLFTDSNITLKDASIEFKPFREPIKITFTKHKDCEINSIEIYKDDLDKPIFTISKKIGNAFYWNGKLNDNKEYISEGVYTFFLKGDCNNQNKTLNRKIVVVNHLKPQENLYKELSDYKRKTEYRYTNKYRWWFGIGSFVACYTTYLTMLVNDKAEGIWFGLAGIPLSIAIPHAMKPAKIPDKANIEYNNMLEDRFIKTNQKIFKDNFRIKLTKN